MKIKIGAAGSCVSRDPFNSLFNPDYKSYFDFNVYQFQPTLISLMSQPIGYDSSLYEFKESVSENTDWHFRTELNKRFLNEVVVAQPHYLILDFYSDILFGVIKVGKSFITNKKNIFEKNTLFNHLDLQEEYSVFSDFEEYKKLFEVAADKFMAFCSEYLPNTKIVVNKARFTNQYWDEITQQIVYFGNKNEGHYENRNAAWDQLDNLFIDKYNVHSISFSKSYYADPHYRYGGLHTVHYKNNFYVDFKDKLLAIVLEDLTERKIDVYSSVKHPTNLVQNSNFSNGTASWKVFDSSIFRVQENKLVVKSFGNDKNQWKQVVSDAIEINADEDKYFFSFCFEDIDLSDMSDDEPIVNLRTFGNRANFKAKDSIQELKITKGEVLAYLNDNSTNRYARILELSGRYLKVIPYLQRNGHYSIADFFLKKGSDSEEYILPINERLHHAITMKDLNEKKLKLTDKSKATHLNKVKQRVMSILREKDTNK